MVAVKDSRNTTVTDIKREIPELVKWGYTAGREHAAPKNRLYIYYKPYYKRDS